MEAPTGLVGSDTRWGERRARYGGRMELRVVQRTIAASVLALALAGCVGGDDDDDDDDMTQASAGTTIAQVAPVPDGA